MKNSIESNAGAGQPDAPEVKSDWQDETSQYSSSIKSFLSDTDLFDKFNDSEVHISGMNTAVLTAIRRGEAEPMEVMVFYKNGKIPAVIHAVYDSQDTGHNIDIYLKGPALEKFLEQNRLEKDKK